MGVDGGKGDVQLGSGPEEMRVGDVVVVLYGCNVPVIIRPVSGATEGEGEDCEEEDTAEGGTDDGKILNEGDKAGKGTEVKGDRKEPGWMSAIRERKEKREKAKIESQRRWEFVGEAFVEGFMDAEALAWLVKGRGAVESFGLV